jgi:NTE family protein
LYLHYNYNSLNEVFYATKGTFLNVNLSKSLQNTIDVKFSDPTIANVSGSTNNFIKLGATFEKRLQLRKNTTGIIGFNTAFIFEDPISDGDVELSEFGVGANYFIGGIIANPRKDSYVFAGLNDSELTASQFMRLHLGLQFNTANNIYITPHVDVARVGFGNFNDFAKDAFTARGRWTDAQQASLLASAGATFSYDSILGPVNFDVSWVNNTNKVRFLIGIGLHFNRSN